MGRRIIIVFTLLTMHIVAFAQSVPFPTDNLAAWFSADSVHLTADNHVDTLYDKSGNERHAIQMTSGKQPVWVEEDEYINNQPTIYFDGNDFMAAASDELFAQPNTFFVVWKTNRNNLGVCITGANNSQRNQLVASGSDIYLYCGKILSAKTMSAPFNHSFIQAFFNGSLSFVSYNGEKIITGDVGQFPNKGIFIGAENGGSYGTIGNISEVIFLMEQFLRSILQQSWSICEVGTRIYCA